MSYIASTNGMVRSIHFCMNKVVDSEISLSDKSHEKCPKCGMEEKRTGCCSDEQSIVKLDTNHQSSEVGFEAPIFFLITLEATCFVESISFTKASFHKDLIREFSSVPIYKRDCSYLI